MDEIKLDLITPEDVEDGGRDDDEETILAELIELSGATSPVEIPIAPTPTKGETEETSRDSRINASRAEAEKRHVKKLLKGD